MFSIIIIFFLNYIQILGDVTRPEYGYKHYYCDKVTYSGFRGSGQWWIDELQKPLPIGWRQMIDRVQGSGPYSTRFSWYSPDKRAPARGEAIGYGQLSTVACFD